MAIMTELLDNQNENDSGISDTSNAAVGEAPLPTDSAPDSVSAHEAALLLVMKEPAVVAYTPEQETPRSILNAASDSSDAEDITKTGVGRLPAVTTMETMKVAAPDDDEEEDLVPPRHGEKGVQYTLSELFVNPNLKLKSANAVLKKDPFAIPRATDNVTEYRPRFNPLSILVSEEKLLPRDFKFDFSEGIPGEPMQPRGGKAKALGKRGKETQGRGSRSNSDFDASSLLVRKAAVPPIRNPQVFGDKLATMGLLMGSMPRQPQATPTPLINTPTVHNPFGETLLELVANDPPQATEYGALQRLRAATAPEVPYPSSSYEADLIQLQQPPPPVALAETLGAEFDAFGVDLHNISNLSKLSIAANNVAAADPTVAFHAGGTSNGVPVAASVPGLYGGLATYLPHHVAEKRGPQSLVLDPSLYEVGPYHEYPTDGYYAATYASTPAQSGYDAQLPREHQSIDSTTSSASSQSQPQSQSQSLQPIAKKPRSKNVFRPCTSPGCVKGARGKSGLCQKHGGGKRCATANCPKGAQGSSKFCLFHGGGYRCTVNGCTTGARGTSGLCAKHGGYKRARSGGDGDGEEGANGPDEEQGEGGPADKKPRMESYEGRALEAAS